MRPELPERPEEGLDPEDWESLRKLGHRMVDDLIAYHAGLSDTPAWQPVGVDEQRSVQLSFPQGSTGAEDTYQAFLNTVRPFHYSNVHPRGWGWVNGTGSTLGAFAEMLAAGMNPNVWGGHHSAPLVEEAVLSFFRAALGFPPEASGLLVSGGSVANLVALAAAREAGAEGDVSRAGLYAGGKQMVAYASERVHNSVEKAVGLLGIGWDNLRKVTTDREGRMNVGALAAQVAADRGRGFRPVCVVATAGTVDTGAIDPLEEIGEFCRRESLWMHVDGAFGALAALSPVLKPQVRGIEKADSLAFDLHKWLYVPIEAGAVLVRHPEWHRRPFSPPAPYLAMFDRGVASGPLNFGSLGPQLTRGFRALKIWMFLRAHGSEVFGRLIEQNVRQARHLETLVAAHPSLELMAPVPLNVVCFRYRPGDLPETQLAQINQEVLLRLQESGIAVPSSTVLEGRYTLRVAFTNHRTRIADVDRLVEAAVSIGNEIAGETAGSGA